MGVAYEVGQVSGFAGPAAVPAGPGLAGHGVRDGVVRDAFGAGPEAVVVAAVDASGAAKSMTRLPGSYVAASP